MIPSAPALQSGGGAQPPPWLYLAALAVTLVVLSALALRRQQVRRRMGGRLPELAVLAEIGQAIAGARLELGALAELVYRQASQIVDTSFFQLGLFEADRYRLLIWRVDGQPHPPREFRLTPEARGIVGWVRDSGRSLLVRDFEAEADHLPARPRYLSADPPRSAVFVPLRVGEAVLGAMAIQSRRPNAFSDEHLRLLSIVASHAGAALQNARLLEQAQQRATQLQQLAEVSQSLNAIQSLPDLCAQAVSLAAARFGDYAVSYFEVRPDGLHLCATTRPEWQTRAPLIHLGEGLVGEAALTRQEVIVQRWPEFPREGLDVPAVEAVSELAVPVAIEGRLLGVLHAQDRGGAAFDDNTVSVFKSLASQLAVAILEGQLYEAERRRSEQLAAIAHASRVVTSTLEVDDLFDEVLDLLDDRFGFEQTHIFLLHEDQLRLRAGVGRGVERLAGAGQTYPLHGDSLIARVGRTGQAGLAADASLAPAASSGGSPSKARSEMAAAMAMGPRLLGVLHVQSTEPQAFTEADLQTLQTLADTLAVALRNAHLFEAERRRRRLAETLREVSAAVTATLHLDDVLALILTGLARVVSYEAASILLVNDLQELVLRAGRGVRADRLQSALGQIIDVTLFPADSALPPTIAFEEVDPRRAYHDLLALPDPHACLGALLAVRGEHLGYLVVDRAGRDPFPAEEVELIAAFASQAAVAIENARLYTAQREQAWVSTALFQVAEATARAAELPEVLETVVRLTPMLVGVDSCAIFLGEGELFALQTYHAADDAGGARALAPSVSPAAWPRLAEMLRTSEPVVTEADDGLPEGLQALGAGLLILLPLLAKGRVQGMLVVGQSPGETPFTTHRIRLLGGIAHQAAVAIESALLYQAQQEEAWISTALLQVAEAVAEQPTLEAGLDTVARLTPMLVGVERLAIYQWDEVGKVFHASHVVGMEASRLAELDTPAPELGLAPPSPPAAPYPLALPGALARALGADTGMVWPLRARGDLLGALIVAHSHPEALGRRLGLLNGIAHQLALAMENARLAREVAQQQRLERELELGHDIQASFLPEACPAVPGWDVCAYWRAARQVGGDFYDFIPLRAREGAAGFGRWGIVIADVADKGVPAALYMALARTLLRTVAIGRVSPATTLARVNHLVLADARSDQFVSVFYGVWEPATGRLTYAVGGHNPPLWVNAAGEARTLHARGMPLGVLDEAHYDEREIHLAPGDVVLLFTDGVTDAVNAADQEFGSQRLEAVLRRARGGSAAEIVDEIVRAVREHVAGTEAYDDMTLVVVKRAAA